MAEVIAEIIAYGVVCGIPLLFLFGGLYLLYDLGVKRGKQAVEAAPPVTVSMAVDDTALATTTRTATRLNGRQWRQLSKQRRQQAAAAYIAARGTQHHQLLSDAHDKLNGQLTTLENDEKRLHKKRQELQDQIDQTLDMYWQKQILLNNLSEIKGVGDKRRQQLRNLFNVTLDDLYYADNKISGIGPNVGTAINRWIDSQKRRLPQLRTQPFAERQQLVGQLEADMEEATGIMNELAKRKAPLKALSQQVRTALPNVTLDETQFVEEMLQGGEVADRYMRGVFAEWEPMPDWLQEAMLV